MPRTYKPKELIAVTCRHPDCRCTFESKRTDVYYCPKCIATHFTSCRQDKPRTCPNCSKTGLEVSFTGLPRVRRCKTCYHLDNKQLTVLGRAIGRAGGSLHVFPSLSDIAPYMELHNLRNRFGYRSRFDMAEHPLGNDVPVLENLGLSEYRNYRYNSYVGSELDICHRIPAVAGGTLETSNLFLAPFEYNRADNQYSPIATETRLKPRLISPAETDTIFTSAYGKHWKQEAFGNNRNAYYSHTDTVKFPSILADNGFRPTYYRLQSENMGKRNLAESSLLAADYNMRQYNNDGSRVDADAFYQEFLLYPTYGNALYETARDYPDKLAGLLPLASGMDDKNYNKIGALV